MISGVLILNKGQGITSQGAVTRVRRLFGAEKAGHTGTLDPLATGVLPILVGRAVKASEFLLSGDKFYRAGLLLGKTTDTEDITGTVLSEYTGEMPGEDEVRKAVASMVGKQTQTPPMYSALKVGGQKLCDLARRGIEVEREAREITVFSIGVSRGSEREYLLDVACSKGTYIRTLCADIGKKLGTGAVMASLERTKAAGYTIEESVTLEALEAMSIEERLSLLRPTESVFSSLRAFHLPPFFARLARAGQAISLAKIGERGTLGERVALYDGETFFAVGEIREEEKEGKRTVAVKPIRQFDV